MNKLQVFEFHGVKWKSSKINLILTTCLNHSLNLNINVITDLALE